MESGDEWVSLRVCLVCGDIGCCDSSPGKHATGHAESTGHTVIQEFSPGESFTLGSRWQWCYTCKAKYNPETEQSTTNTDPLIDAYFSPTPNGWKLTVALEELGLPYRVLPVDLRNGEQFRLPSPENKIPVLVDRREEPAVRVFESAAILMHLALKSNALKGIVH